MISGFHFHSDDNIAATVNNTRLGGCFGNTHLAFSFLTHLRAVMDRHRNLVLMYKTDAETMYPPSGSEKNLLYWKMDKMDKMDNG